MTEHSEQAFDAEEQFQQAEKKVRLEPVSLVNSDVNSINEDEVDAVEEDTAPVLDADYWLYAGDVSREGYELVSKKLEGLEQKKSKAFISLTTYGGDPNAGFRIARAFGHHYKHFTCIISDRCKSAGTLICIAANELVICDMGELGPLDIQLSKPDEMFEHSSGLDILQSIALLQRSTLDAFRDYLLEIRLGSQISTKLSSEIASKLAIGFMSPITAQIDPLRLGEHQRAMTIAKTYGTALDARSKNLKPGMLEKLLVGYPSHSYVIDRKEAAQLFKKVRSPEGPEYLVGHICRELIKCNKINPAGDPIVELLNQVISVSLEEAKENP